MTVRMTSCKSNLMSDGILKKSKCEFDLVHSAHVQRPTCGLLPRDMPPLAAKGGLGVSLPLGDARQNVGHILDGPLEPEGEQVCQQCGALWFLHGQGPNGLQNTISAPPKQLPHQISEMLHNRKYLNT